ncbi:MAG: SET domain-containing protein [Thermoplasmatota archaeon]
MKAREPLRAAPLGPPGTRPARIPGRSQVRVARSGVHGRGLFANRAFAPGERVLQYMGVLLDKEAGETETDRQWERGRVYTFELNRTYDIDGSPAWTVARLANHSCDPNCESKNDRGRAVWIVALKEIPKGAELTYDYNFDFVDPPPPCHCGAKKCRGYMVGSDYVKDLNRWLRKKGKPTV